MKKIFCVIPAQEKNNYSNFGDLCPWGESTLLEWKISQLQNIKYIKEIYVYTDSKKIITFLKNKKNIKIFFRKNNSDISKSYQEVGKKFKNVHILWANCTCPFVSKKIVIDLIKSYLKSNFYKDGIVTSLKQKEYFFDKKGPVNKFLVKKKIISRKYISTFYKISNGLFLSHSGNYINGAPFGERPIHHIVNWITSLEIKNIFEMNLYSGLMSNYLFSNHKKK
jgi:CMP-N-acetylneuraminic acid synthetase